MRKFLLLIALIISVVGLINAQNVGDNTIINYEGYSLKFTVTSVEPAECEVTCSTQPTSLADVTIPSSVEIKGNDFSVVKLSNQAFYLCSNLRTIEIPYTVRTLDWYAFHGCSALTSVIFGENSQLASINGDAFYKCSSLTSIVIPNTVTAIGSSAFMHCSNLETITFGENSQLKTIDIQAFSNCPILTNIEIPSAVTDIAQKAFYGCSKLATLTFEDNSQLVSIGNSAFNGCTTLIGIEIPNSVTTIGSYAFSGCSVLAAVTFGEDSQLNDIDSFTFYNCSSLTSIEIPFYVNSIGSSAFYGCSKLASVTFNGSYNLTSIENYTFYNCSSLTSIEIPNSVTSIGGAAFCSSYGLTSIEIPNTVTSIGNYAFYNCYNIVNIEIPNGVTTIGSSAFYRCNIVSIPNSVTSIGDNAFESCDFESNSLKIPYGLTNIGSSVFYNCSYLKNVEISSTITSIGNNAFSNCSNLSSVIFDENSQLTSIGSYAFGYCSNLSSIEIPNPVASIGDNAFAYSGLKSVVIPNTVTTIGNDAFYHNYLQSVVIPSSVTSIGNGAFSANTLSLGIYFYRTTPPTFGGSQFGYPYPNIYVPSISLESYKNAENMAWYSENIIGMPTYTSDGWIDANGNNIAAPETTDYVSINAPMVLSGNTRTNDVLTVNTIGITENGSLTIKNGGQLVANSVTGEVTVENQIAGYGEELSWHTISSPLKAEVNLASQDNGINLLSGNYELYRYDEPTYTWWNYKNSINNGFTSLESGRGYIYANSENVTMSFTGNANTDDVVYNLTNDADVLTGFHLIGNPFTHNITADNFTLDNATLAAGYYVLSNEGDWGVRLANDGVIKPTQGALIKATITDKEKAATLTLNNNVSSQRTKADGQDSQYLSISVSNDRYSDKAIVLFGEGIGLDKINHQNENSPLLYVPMEVADYAVAVIDKNFKEIPVNFEANVMGEYTISLKQENCEFEELYLLDKETGDKVNILEEDYTFIASVNDDSDRFILLQDHSQQPTANGNFAYVSGKELIINDEGTVQIIDMMGRVVYSNDVTNDNNKIDVSDFDSAAYIIRVINENGINVQKIVL